MNIGTKEIANAFAELLNIRIIKGITSRESTKLRESGVSFTEFDYKPVAPEIKKQFAKELENFICEKTREKDSLIFAYEYGPVRPIGTINENITDELSMVLAKLPELAIAETYSLPCETIMEVAVANRTEISCLTKFRFSQNIAEKLP